MMKTASLQTLKAGRDTKKTVVEPAEEGESTDYNQGG